MTNVNSSDPIARRTATRIKSGTPGRSKLKISEANVKIAVYQYLTTKNYFWWPSKTVGVYSAKRGCRLKDPWLRLGVSDILMLWGGALFAIELKGSHGYQSKAQKEFEAKIKSEGGIYLLVRSIDDLQRAGL